MNGASVSVARAKTSSDSDGNSRQAQRIERQSFGRRDDDRRRRSLRRPVIDRLDVVAVGVEHERGVVAGMVMPLARRAVVAAAGIERRHVEALYGPAIG